MAINTFTFGGVTSSDFGIYVSGEGLFNAPKRSAEVVTIPGRNGDLIVDNGSFENIEITYRVFNQEKDLDDFRTKLGNLRNALASKVGYQRLTDTFHPTEYRMAAFVDGVEITPIKYNTAAEFEIKFNCKPQRFLTSGETAVAVASGGTLKNPTLFDARPLIEVGGYGTINLGNNSVKVNDNKYGYIAISGENYLQSGTYYPYRMKWDIDGDLVSIGDTIYLDKVEAVADFYVVDGKNWSGFIAGESTSNPNAYWAAPTLLSCGLRNLQFTAGTSQTQTAIFSCQYECVGETTITKSLTMTVTYTYSGGTHTIRADIYLMALGSTSIYRDEKFSNVSKYVMADSTATPSGWIIDLEIGEVYANENGQIVSKNQGVVIPPELPTLPPGTTTITYDNTFTSVKIAPRWWKV